jgi:hypothetical protein
VGFGTFTLGTALNTGAAVGTAAGVPPEGAYVYRRPFEPPPLPSTLAALLASPPSEEWLGAFWAWGWIEAQPLPWDVDATPQSELYGLSFGTNVYRRPMRVPEMRPSIPLTSPPPEGWLGAFWAWGWVEAPPLPWDVEATPHSELHGLSFGTNVYRRPMRVPEMRPSIPAPKPGSR